MGLHFKLILVWMFIYSFECTLCLPMIQGQSFWGHTFGLAKELSMETETINFLKRRGNYMTLKSETKIWERSWLETKTAPEVKLTNDMADWWNMLVFRKPPKKMKRGKYGFPSWFCGCKQKIGRSTSDARKQKQDTQYASYSNFHTRRKRGTSACDLIPDQEVLELNRTLTSVPKVTRIEWRRMNTEMRENFRDAVNRLATFPPDPNQPDTSAYDIFVGWHNFANAPGAHLGASFLPWHREFLWRFENALRERGYEYGLPYWDSALEAILPDPSMSALFTEQHMGVSNGPVSTWAGVPTSVTAPPACWIAGSSVIQRDALSLPTTRLFTRNNVQEVLSLDCYRDLTWGWNTKFEGHHNTGHVWFGWNSHMINSECSPVDPMFWMHHGYVDLIWEKFRETQDSKDREIDYPLENLGVEPSEMARNNEMKPFSSQPGFGHTGDVLLNIQGLSNYYIDNYYQYEDRPSSIICNSDDECNGEGPGLLWCDIQTQFCYAKIQEGGACKSEWPVNQCWCLPVTNAEMKPVCQNEICQCQVVSTAETTSSTRSTEAVVSASTNATSGTTATSVATNATSGTTAASASTNETIGTSATSKSTNDISGTTATSSVTNGTSVTVAIPTTVNITSATPGTAVTSMTTNSSAISGTAATSAAVISASLTEANVSIAVNSTETPS